LESFAEKGLSDKR